MERPSTSLRSVRGPDVNIEMGYKGKRFLYHKNLFPLIKRMNSTGPRTKRSGVEGLVIYLVLLSPNQQHLAMQLQRILLILNRRLIF